MTITKQPTVSETNQIMETVSENTPKRKRGRPIGLRGICAKASSSYTEAATSRSHLNFWLSVELTRIIKKLSDERANEVFGFTYDDMRDARHPEKRKGMMTASVQIIRWIETHGTEEGALDIIADARGNEFSWAIIGNHFRTLRLGKREGNAQSLTQAMTVAFDKFMARYPATNLKVQVAAIENLLDVVIAKDE
jgi:hypothetical protein